MNESDPRSNVNNNIINSNNIIKVQTKISIHWKIIINNGENSISITLPFKEIQISYDKHTHPYHRLSLLAASLLHFNMSMLMNSASHKIDKYY